VEPPALTEGITIDVHLPEGGPMTGIAADARMGLSAPFKELPPKYFYDERGSRLFEEITKLPEYYPSRSEREILEDRSADIVAAAEPRALVELGSGSAAKTRVLLDAMDDADLLELYAPIDISEQITRETAATIATEYDGVAVHGLVCDYELDLERIPDGGRRVVAFLGGTIGNFEPAQRSTFLRRVSNLLGPDDRFLLGTDLIKDRQTLEAAYNDSQGVTAEFNKNVLAVMNTELGADFDLGAFEHIARWDPENLWMDIRLRSLRDQVVDVSALGLLVTFEQGEEMRTEISTKFAQEGLRSILAEAGLQMTDWFTDREGLFGLSLVRVA
jgi:L-histidine Nalpha-methyltransferase